MGIFLPIPFHIYIQSLYFSSHHLTVQLPIPTNKHDVLSHSPAGLTIYGLHAVSVKPWTVLSCGSSTALISFLNLHSFMFSSISYFKQLVLKFTTNPYCCRKSAPITIDSISWPETRKTCSNNRHRCKLGHTLVSLFSGSYCQTLLQ